MPRSTSSPWKPRKNSDDMNNLLVHWGSKLESELQNQSYIKIPISRQQTLNFKSTFFFQPKWSATTTSSSTTSSGVRHDVLHPKGAVRKKKNRFSLRKFWEGGRRHHQEVTLIQKDPENVKSLIKQPSQQNQEHLTQLRRLL